MQYLGEGSGVDGYLHITTDTTEAPIDAVATGTAATDAVSATNASFSPNQMIMIHQSQGTGAGNWELNFIESYSAGSIVTTFDLINTYATGAQVRVVPQYSGVLIDAGVTYSTKAWDGSVGGIFWCVCSGLFDVEGALSGNGKGFRGGAGGASVNGGNGQIGVQGESSTGYSSTRSTSANGSGGGGGGTGGDAAGGGGGAGHAASGTAGGAGQSGGGAGGATDGLSDLTVMVMGAGGGGGGGESNANAGSYVGGTGGRGGGIIGIYANSIVVGASGSIPNEGASGTAPTGAYQEGSGGGGGGAGGSTYLSAIEISIGNGRVTSSAGLGGSGSGSLGGAGGLSSVGRIVINCCSLASGDASIPAATSTIGGHDFCQSFIHIWDS